MGRGAGGAGQAGLFFVEGDPGAQQMNGDFSIGVGDGEGFAVYGDGVGFGESPVTEFLKEGEQPAVAGEAGGGVVRGVAESF